MRALEKCATIAGALAAMTASLQAEVIAYPRVPGDAANGDYVRVVVDGVPVESVMTDLRVGYAHFAVKGAATIAITAREPIRSFDLSPHRLGLQAVAEGNVLRFALPGPCKLHLRINGLPRFFIFGDAPESEVPQLGAGGATSLADYGVGSDPERNQTAAIQRALDESAARRSVLVVPAGIYRSGRLVFPSGLSLYLAPGAILKGTGRLEDYAQPHGETQQILVRDAARVRVFGRGVIDGFGQALRRAGRDDPRSKAKLFSVQRCRDVRLEDVILRGAGVWNVHLAESRDVRCRDLKVIALTRLEHTPADGPFFGGNTDGFDPDNSSGVRIENCFISCDDDAIAVKLNSGEPADASDIEFRGNVVWTMCSALKIGTEIRERTIRRVVFADNDIVNADVGIAVWCWRGGAVEDAQWINNSFEAVGVAPNDSPHKKETNLRLTIRDVTAAGFGRVRGLRIRDNTFERFSPNDALLQGGDEGHRLEDVVFENLVIAGRRCVTDEDARLTIGRFTRGIVFQ